LRDLNCVHKIEVGHAQFLNINLKLFIWQWYWSTFITYSHVLLEMKSVIDRSYTGTQVVYTLAVAALN